MKPYKKKGNIFFFFSIKVCEILYKVDNYYSKENEKGINYKNKELNIEWPLTSKINISEKDASYDINENIFPFNPI